MLAGVLLLICFMGFYSYKWWIRPYQIRTSHFSSDYYKDCVAHNLAKNYPEGCVIFFGNSILAEFPIEDISTPQTLVKYAIRGAFSEELNNRWSLLEHKPSKVVIMLGINDLLYGLDALHVREEVSKFVDAASGEGVEVIVVSVLPVSFEDGVFANRDALNTLIRETNQEYADLCEDSSCDFLNIHTHFVDEHGNLAQGLAYDGVHLTAEGHEILSEVFSNLLRE